MTLQHDFILLDRSGSMANMWVEALGGINAYVKKLADDKVDTGVTLIVFDGINAFEIIRNRITPSTWKPVTDKDATPRGMTPLNDATARMIQHARMGAPWGAKYDRMSFVIVTDGVENASHEFSPYNGGTQKVKDMLAGLQSEGHAVTYLGANFDNVAQAAGYGASLQQTVSATAQNFGDTMYRMAGKRGLYAATGQSASMSWTPEEQAEAKTDKSDTK